MQERDFSINLKGNWDLLKPLYLAMGFTPIVLGTNQDCRNDKGLKVTLGGLADIHVRKRLLLIGEN